MPVVSYYFEADKIGEEDRVQVVIFGVSRAWTCGKEWEHDGDPRFPELEGELNYGRESTVL